MNAPDGADVPYLPVDFHAPHVTAIQSLKVGTCSAELQKEFYRWLIEEVCATFDQSFRVDPYNTAFAEGRRFVGNTCRKLEILDAKKVAEAEKQLATRGGKR